jgi:hypothetical protein
MSMNLGRGFFRTWLVLSAIWIGLFIYFYEPITYAWLWRARLVDIETPSGHRVTFDTSKSNKELVADVTAEVRREAERLKARDGNKAGSGMFNDLIPSTPEYVSNRRDEILAVINSAGEDYKRAWQVTFIPPLALLAFGLSIA